MPTAHWVQRNETSRAPNRWVWLDTEANRHEDGGAEVQTWRLGVTCFDHLNERSRIWQPPTWHRHHNPVHLWETIDSYTRADTRTIVMAHNMGYDVRISAAIPLLRGLGWELTRWQVSDQGCVLRWRKDSKSLWLCDSYSWLPKALGEIGSLINHQKTEWPGFDADTDTMFKRCEQDVVILREAMLPLVKWVRDDDLGNWQPTGGAMAWANWRHKHYSHPVLVHDDEDARHAERAAGFTGRCEAWLHGRLSGGTWAEWDLPLAYPRVCLETPLPTILRGRIIGPNTSQVVKRDPKNRYLVLAEIKSETPTLPVRQDNRIKWPVGHFQGWYWDHELCLAAEQGARIRPLTAYRYSASTALADWAEWVISVVEDETLPYTPLQRLAAKNWARALIGRFGVRYWAWEDWGDDDIEGVRMDWLVNHDTRQVGRILHVAGKMFGADTMAEGANSIPAIMSAIMAECRVRLWHIMNTAGLENVAYCDTDSVIVNDAGTVNLYESNASANLWGLRPKSRWDSLTVIGPRQLILDGHHRVAGVSRGAERTGPLQWVGERWEGLTQAAEQGRADKVVIRPTRWELTGVDNRRQHEHDGTTSAYRINLADVVP